MSRMDRREFIAATAMATTAAAMARAADAPMKLSLSTRNVEGARNATEIQALLPFEDFLKIAKTAGYDAISVRAAAGGLQTALNRLYEMSRLTKAAGLRVSMVTPDFPVPLNNDRAPECLRNITPYLNVAQIFECDQIRIGMKKEEDVRVGSACRGRGARAETPPGPSRRGEHTLCDIRSFSSNFEAGE